MEQGFILQSIFLLKDIMASWNSVKKKKPSEKLSEQELIPDFFS